MIVRRVFSAIFAVAGSQIGYYKGLTDGVFVCGFKCGVFGAHVGSTAGHMVGSTVGNFVGGAALWIYDEIWLLALDVVNDWYKEKEKNSVGLLELDDKKIMDSLVNSAARFAFTAST